MKAVLRSRAIFRRLWHQIIFFRLQVKNVGFGSTHKARFRLQITDFDTKYLKNLNFNEKASINLDFVRKTVSKNLFRFNLTVGIGSTSTIDYPKIQ